MNSEFGPFSFETIAFHWVSRSDSMLAVTLQIQDKELPTSVHIGPVRKGQHQFFQQAAGTNLISVVVVVFPKLTSHVLLNGQPLVCWMAVDKENFQEPVDINAVYQSEQDNKHPYSQHTAWCKANKPKRRPHLEKNQLEYFEQQEVLNSRRHESFLSLVTLKTWPESSSLWKNNLIYSSPK